MKKLQMNTYRSDIILAVLLAVTGNPCHRESLITKSQHSKQISGYVAALSMHRYLTSRLRGHTAADAITMLSYTMRLKSGFPSVSLE